MVNYLGCYHNDVIKPFAIIILNSIEFNIL